MGVEEVRCRLVGVLRERLTELEDDELRLAHQRAISWDDLKGGECRGCHREVFRIFDGRCLGCLRKEEDREKQMAQLREKGKKYGLLSWPKKKKSLLGITLASPGSAETGTGHAEVPKVEAILCPNCQGWSYFFLDGERCERCGVSR